MARTPLDLGRLSLVDFTSRPIGRAPDVAGKVTQGAYLSLCFMERRWPSRRFFAGAVSDGRRCFGTWTWGWCYRHVALFHPISGEEEEDDDETQSVCGVLNA
ncbi:hypothetical protein PF008_g22437 [Phytophthora fragariae]|uniref:Uncharacterized protein n=1 Tax=Phytophthora fragariae TaxID=53985 RepID=A0A6G0QUS3_9STRA|nr:hypothetical protein PF008_g22437 [Phytophthora fragariae]